MPIFEGAFWKYVWPLLWTGSTGVGIKLYIRDGGILALEVDSSVPNSTTTVKTPYSQKLTEKGLTLVTDSTSENILQNILRQRMYPHYQAKFVYNSGQIFTGSQEFTLDGKEYKTSSDNKKLFIFSKNATTDTDNLKKECKTALAAEYQETTDANTNKATPDPQYYKLKEWCTEPKVKAVLGRHKLTVLNTDENKKDDDDDWKEVIGGGWFSNTNKNQQTFISSSDLTSFLGSKSSTGINSKTDVEEDHIKQLKEKCKKALDESFERNSFPAPKAFLDKLSDTDKKTFSTVDKFQEAAIFCTKPETAKNYVEKAMQGVIRTALPTDMNDDFCLTNGKNISDYESIKTNNPFDGKSFWCAVRILYEKHLETNK